MKNATLVIMAAGIGSRFGGGIKQLEPVGPNGEIIMDYSIYDAREAGFNKVVFVIRKDLEKDFKEVIGNRIEKEIETRYVFQELTDIPECFKGKLDGRSKPWGTGQAILCCKDVVKEPFLVINADDYYGKEAYREAYQYLIRENENKGKKEPVCMIGFRLGNTLSINGGVTRGICKVDEKNMLTDIVETSNIEETEDGAVIKNGDSIVNVDVQSPVSMNMWGLRPEFIDILESGFSQFLSNLKEGDVKSEYLLPTIIGELLQQKKVEVKVLRSKDKWFGVTYKEDKKFVVDSIRTLIQKGIYPEKLF